MSSSMIDISDTSTAPRKPQTNGKATAPAPPNTITVVDGKSPETEPCLVSNGSTNDSSTTKPKRFGRRVTAMVREVEQLVRERSGLSRKGVYYVLGLLVTLLVLCVVVVTLAACWPRTPHHQEYPVCQEGACLRASAQIREALDNSVSPCRDIWTFSCGGWLRQNPLPLDRSSWDQKRELVKLEAARISELITTLPLPVRIGTVDWKLKYFYEACLDVDSVDAEKARPLSQIISALDDVYISTSVITLAAIEDVGPLEGNKLKLVKCWFVIYMS